MRQPTNCNHIENAYTTRNPPMTAYAKGNATVAPACPSALMASHSVLMQPPSLILYQLKELLVKLHACMHLLLHIVSPPDPQLPLPCNNSGPLHPHVLVMAKPLATTLIPKPAPNTHWQQWSSHSLCFLPQHHILNPHPCQPQVLTKKPVSHGSTAMFDNKDLLRPP